ncbi:MAG TPA: SAM-dependent methyltransferase [Rhodobacteraceae bacterium]|jgi:SAM-dependent methyltransferase|nr:class I SAM-dependent methyltransferase [Paracoccaceae bacterium]HBG99848.1 SAM-dependent methyltransferase [Paracoccaceae bacterium]
MPKGAPPAAISGSTRIWPTDDANGHRVWRISIPRRNPRDRAPGARQCAAGRCRTREGTIARKIDTRAVGLDAGLALVRFVTGKENLHYGLWKDGQPVCAAELGAAQEAYTARLLALLPPEPLRILDIGGGAGETAKKLLAMGHRVDIVIPSAALAERCRANAPGAAIHEMGFEDFATADRFDVCLFSESFQYIPVDIALDRAAALLAPGGRIVIADCFRSAACFEARKSGAVVGGGHQLARFERALAARPELRTTHRTDITDAVAPSVELEQAFFNTIGFALSRADQELARARPLQRAMLHWLLRRGLSARRRARLAQRLHEQTRTAEAFRQHNRYLMMVLERA